MTAIPDFKTVKEAIIAALTPDLLSREWRRRVDPECEPRESGHCAVAAEAFYYLAGGKAAGMKPVVCSYREGPEGEILFPANAEVKGQRATHWWIQGPENGVGGTGKIYDVTVGQYNQPFPYERGRGTGFQNPNREPSRRAQTVIDRVTEMLGKEAVTAFRRRFLADFVRQKDQAAQNHRQQYGFEVPKL